MKTKNDEKLEIDAAIHLSSVEIILGSVGHGFKIPFTGTFLSFYQLYVCLKMLIRNSVPSIQVFNVSVIVALLKTLSPFGKKLTPMIAITVQGFLLWLGSALFGGRLLGVFIGSVLFVSWSLLQSMTGYLLIYGFDFLKMLDFLQNELGRFTSINIYLVLAAYIFIRIAIVIVMILYLVANRASSQVWSLEESLLKRFQTRYVRIETAKGVSIWKNALRDLFNPFFLLSLLLMSLFHLYKDSSYEQTIWFICRTLAVGFLLFYLTRSSWVKRGLISYLGSNRRFRELYKKMYRVRKDLILRNTKR